MASLAPRSESATFSGEVPSSAARRGGIALSGLAILFLAMDGVGKLFAPELMIANSPAIGIPAEVDFYRLLGGILAICTALYAWPRMAVWGAVLLTAYLGGAVATHLIAGSPLLSHTLFGVYLGLIVWGGLWLRKPRVRSLLS